jgi:membrane protease YdiL (CAAX protease family)
MATRRRVRCALLIPAARLAVPLVLAFVWPLACVRATWWALGRLPFHDVSTHLLIGASLFIAASLLTIVDRPIDRVRSPAVWFRAIAVFVTSAAGFAVLSVAAGLPVTLLVAPIAIATLAAAIAEEAVFRAYLPDRLSRSLRQAGTRPFVTSAIVLVIPQLAFAAAHAENAGFASAGMRTFVNLFVAGLLYRGVTKVCGLWAAAALHAALNLTIAFVGLSPNPTQ